MYIGLMNNKRRKKREVNPQRRKTMSGKLSVPLLRGSLTLS